MNIFLFTTLLLGNAQVKHSLADWNPKVELGPQPWPETWVDRLLPVSEGDSVSVDARPRQFYGTGNQCEDVDNNRFYGGSVLYDRFTKRESTCLDNGREAFWTNILTADLEDHYLCWNSCRGENNVRERPLTCEKWCTTVGDRIKFSWNFERGNGARNPPSGTGALPEKSTFLPVCKVEEFLPAMIASRDLGEAVTAQLLEACPVLVGQQTDDCVCAETLLKYRRELNKIDALNCEFVTYGLPLLEFMEKKVDDGGECEAQNEWEVMDGFCRTARGGSGSFTRKNNIASAALCQLECKESRNCVAAEYQPKRRLCELHRDAITSTSNGRNSGAQCFVRKDFQTLEGYCRTTSGGSGTFSRVEDVRSARGCQRACKERRGCVAAEYQPTRRLCELHTDPVSKSTGQEQDKTQCFLNTKQGGPTAIRGGMIEKIVTETEYTEIEVIIKIKNGRTRTEIIRVPASEILDRGGRRRLAAKKLRPRSPEASNSRRRLMENQA